MIKIVHENNNTQLIANQDRWEDKTVETEGNEQRG